MLDYEILINNRYLTKLYICTNTHVATLFKFEASDGCHIVFLNDNSLIFFLLEAVRFSLPDLHVAATGTNYKILKKEQLEELKINLSDDKLIN